MASVDGVALVDAINAVDEHCISFWDAMLWATARQAGCSTVFSEHMQHGRRLGGVEFVNPFAAKAGPASALHLFGRQRHTHAAPPATKGPSLYAPARSTMMRPRPRLMT